MKRIAALMTAVLTAVFALGGAARAADARLIRAFLYDDTLYTYMTISGMERPITQAEAKIDAQSYPATARLGTVEQAGFPITYLLLVDNSDSMPAFREQMAAFAQALAESSGPETRFILATLGDRFAVVDDDVPADGLAAAVDALPLTERVTRLHSCTDAALDYLENLPREGNELRNMVILSDAVLYDPIGEVSYEALMERVTNSDVMLHFLGVGTATASLERMTALIASNDGTSFVARDAAAAEQAAKTISEENGNYYVTGFSLQGAPELTGEQPFSVTLVSDGAIVCRAESVLILPQAEAEPAENDDHAAQSEDAPEPEAPEENDAETPELAETSEAASAATVPADTGKGSSEGGIVPIVIAAAVAAALVAGATVFFLMRGKRRQPAPAPREEDHEPEGIYLRFVPQQGDYVGERTDYVLTRELVFGSAEDCDIRYHSDSLDARHGRLYLRRRQRLRPLRLHGGELRIRPRALPRGGQDAGEVHRQPQHCGRFQLL